MDDVKKYRNASMTCQSLGNVPSSLASFLLSSGWVFDLTCLHGSRHRCMLIPFLHSSILSVLLRSSTTLLQQHRKDQVARYFPHPLSSALYQALLTCRRSSTGQQLHFAMNTVEAMYQAGFAWPIKDINEMELSPIRRTALTAHVTKPLNLPLRQRSLGAELNMARYRSDSAVTEPRLSVCSTSGTVYESVVVVGHTYGSSDKVVYYLLEVRSWEKPLEGYVVRRRYNDFRKFHHELTPFMPSKRPRSSTTIGFGLPYSSLLCNPLTTESPEASPLWSPTRIDDGRVVNGTDQRRASLISKDSSNSPQQLVEENKVRSSAPAVLTEEFRPNGGVASYNSNAMLPLNAVKCNLAGRPWLPSMPSGGMLTMLTTRRALINYRIEQFNHILAAVMSDKSSDVGSLLMNFIQEKPGTQAQTYTNLSEYAPIDIPFNIERHARRRAMSSIGKRPLRDQSLLSRSLTDNE